MTDLECAARFLGDDYLDDGVCVWRSGGGILSDGDLLDALLRRAAEKALAPTVEGSKRWLCTLWPVKSEPYYGDGPTALAAFLAAIRAMEAKP